MKTSSAVRGLLLFAIASLPGAALATTYYVSTTGNDNNSGSSGSPFATWQKGLNTAQAGDTVQVSAGTYRGQNPSFPRSGTGTSPITLQAAPGATVILKGSTVVSNWVLNAGSTYTSSGWTSYFGSWGQNPEDARSKARNQLFVNGVYVQEVPTQASLFAGSFFIDQTAQKIYLWLSDGSSPIGKTVEVTSTAGPLLTTNGQNYINLQGLQFQHCANSPQGSAAVRIPSGSNCTASNLNVQWAAGAGFELSGSNNTVSNSVFNNNGQLGIHSGSAVNCAVEQCETSLNNTLAGKQFDTGWEAGGNKFALSNGVTVNGHLAHDNIGPGLWFDVANQFATITNCTCYNNQQGIQYEISYTALIANNLCYNNRLEGQDKNGPFGNGIYVSSSAGCTVVNNTCWGNDTKGIRVNGGVRGDGSNVPNQNVYSYATTIYNNICVENQVANAGTADYCLDTVTTVNPALDNTYVAYAPNVSDYNLFYRTDTANTFVASSDLNDSASFYQTLAQWQTATGLDLHSVWGDPLLANPAGGDFHLTSSSPAFDAGITVAEVTADYSGVSRPQGLDYDIGAYEEPALLYQTALLPVYAQTSGITHRIITGSPLPNGEATILDATAVGNFVTYSVPTISPGTYEMRIGVKDFNSRGIWQLAIGPLGSNTYQTHGSPYDEYNANELWTEAEIGPVTFTSTSAKAFQFTVTGKNSASGGYGMAFDYFLLIPQFSTAGGSLSGQVVGGSTSTYNLTSLGTRDWAHWNGTYVHKSSGGSQISNVTQIGGGNYGTFNVSARNVSWSDGTPTGSNSDDQHYIWCNNVQNAGWSFTVPADTTTRTLNVLYGGASPGSPGVTITAHLSDGSAADFTNTETITSSTLSLATFTYHASSASQTLTITLTKTNNSDGASVDLDAAWLQ